MLERGRGNRETRCRRNKDIGTGGMFCLFFYAESEVSRNEEEVLELDQK